jgi:intracellular sulfur oxidation DsrE/DsrF family protein
MTSSLLNEVIDIVSHGSEQFQLTRKSAKKQKAAISILEDLVRNENVDLHVCGTHSSWVGIPASSYIDIVDVAVSGPAKINDYINLGYQPIQLYKPSNLR